MSWNKVQEYFSSGDVASGISTIKSIIGRDQNMLNLPNKKPAEVAAIKELLTAKTTELWLKITEPEEAAALKDIWHSDSYICTTHDQMYNEVWKRKGIITLRILEIKTPKAVASLKGVLPPSLQRLEIGVETPEAAEELAEIITPYLICLNTKISTPAALNKLQGKLQNLITLGVKGKGPAFVEKLCQVITGTTIIDVEGIEDPTGKLQKILDDNRRLRYLNPNAPIPEPIVATPIPQPQLTPRTADKKTADITSEIRQQLKKDSLLSKQLLEVHAAELQTITAAGRKPRNEFETAMQDTTAGKYYLDVISNLNNAYLAASCVSQALTEFNEAGIKGDINNIIAIVCEFLPLQESIQTTFRKIAHKPDADAQRSFQRLVDLGKSLMLINAKATTCAVALINKGHHKDPEFLQNDAHTIIREILSGNIWPDKDLPAQLLEMDSSTKKPLTWKEKVAKGAETESKMQQTKP